MGGSVSGAALITQWPKHLSAVTPRIRVVPVPRHEHLRMWRAPRQAQPGCEENRVGEGEAGTWRPGKEGPLCHRHVSRWHFCLHFTEDTKTQELVKRPPVVTK